MEITHCLLREEPRKKNLKSGFSGCLVARKAPPPLKTSKQANKQKSMPGHFPLLESSIDSEKFSILNYGRVEFDEFFFKIKTLGDIYLSLQNKH